MRTDSYASSTIEDGSLLTGNIGAGTTVQSWIVNATGRWFLSFIVSCDVSFAYYGRFLDTDGTTILHAPLFQSGAGVDVEILPGPLYLVRNQIIRLVTATTIIPATGLQGNIFPQLVGPGASS